jgi:hypothetical protein
MPTHSTLYRVSNVGQLGPSISDGRVPSTDSSAKNTSSGAPAPLKCSAFIRASAGV